MQPTPPGQCESLADIRREIDRIDRGIIHAIGERKHYVVAAAAFKTTQAEVAAPERFAAMLQARRQWAAEEGLNPDVIETLFRELVSYFIAEEKSHWSRGATPAS